MLRSGDLLGNRYKVESVIAKGGMGSVYLVKDSKLNDKVWAVKEITQVQSHEAFLEEARILADLTHPYIPKITDYFEPDANGYCYLVMEYINGVTLQQRFDDADRALSLDTVLKYMKQICEILLYLHRQPTPIVFRDLKPGNIMIDEYDNIRLIDFGIARGYDQGKATDTVQMGTIAFAAPEQFENKQTDPRTDIYALGSVMHYLLSGANTSIKHASR
ncbi:serine/threonine protein kinase [Cohnella cholangitidis]|uniref:non-specific serine/threonine protein kinase n=1 Tax=Cohnella cholangitidis TaxID=2598458 RepID=A0A7G5BU46_9BACL|nr:serine/threonine-protein kinase [Cohnella cholangitidis]QMV40480.1 serine/threonine protein kinase [Cohnella cholangitidis]